MRETDLEQYFGSLYESQNQDAYILMYQSTDTEDNPVYKESAAKIFGNN